MKHGIILFLLLCIAAGSFAQSRFETETDQIAGLESYSMSLKNTYSTTSNGLNTAHDLKNGSMTANQAYFTSLQNVSPAVKSDPHIKDISNLQGQIQQVFSGAISWQQSQKILSSDEVNYMQAVYSTLLSDCGKDLQDLNTVLSSGTAKMTDKQRIDHIDVIWQDMRDKCSFAQSFTRRAYELAVNRSMDNQSNQTLKTLYNQN